MGFKADDISELWDYDLGSYGKPGRVPEPTQTEINRFRDAWRDAQLSKCGMTVEQLDTAGGDTLFAEKLAALTSKERQQIVADVIEIAIEFCKGSPTREEITTMPALQQAGFVNWLIEVMAPLF